VKLDLVPLAFLMFVVTYASRAVPLLVPGAGRLPPRVLAYLELVGPATLAALCAVNALLVVDASRRASLHVGITTLGVVACLSVVAWRRSLFPGLLIAVVVVAAGRAVGVA
jgi:branched-subunit amino acid transport protein